MNDKTYIEMAGRTAITRRKASAPLRVLLTMGCIPHPDGEYKPDSPVFLTEGPRILDYGCGKGADVDHLEDEGYRVHGWDPNHRPHRVLGEPASLGTFDVVLCTYVLNVLPPHMEAKALDHIHTLLKPGGVAYITVRRDIPRGSAGVNASGRTYQRWVELDLPVIAKAKKQFAIYKLVKE